MVTRSPHEARPLSWTPCCVSCRRPVGWAVGTGGWVMRWSGLERLSRRGSVTASVGLLRFIPSSARTSKLRSRSACAALISRLSRSCGGSDRLSRTPPGAG
jgi:hypothetical protein